MKKYTLVMEVTVESDGINRSYPTPKRVKDYVLTQFPLIHYEKIDCSAIEVLVVARSQRDKQRG